ncbi:hypothetical protein L9F63_008543, partial [Diploptera punctata]
MRKLYSPVSLAPVLSVFLHQMLIGERGERKTDNRVRGGGEAPPPTKTHQTHHEAHKEEAKEKETKEA